MMITWRVGTAASKSVIPAMNSSLRLWAAYARNAASVHHVSIAATPDGELSRALPIQDAPSRGGCASHPNSAACCRDDWVIRFGPRDLEVVALGITQIR